MIIGALEAGGTKMVCAIGDENGNIFKEVSIPTTTPDETIENMVAFFKEENIEALGIACFGPIDLHRDSKTYGYITTTPKEGWQNVEIVGAFQRALQIPVGFDTDVNGSMLGEYTYGNGKGLHSCIYATIGTGIGIGVIVEDKLLHGMLHSEGGHILLTREAGDTYQGKCPFHSNCFEGLASGPAIGERFGVNAKELLADHPAWDLEARYIAQALVDYTLVLSPERIILGGGVMKQTQLFPMIRKYFKEYLAGYVVTRELADLDTYICAPLLEDKQGIMGALKLGYMEYEYSQK